MPVDVKSVDAHSRCAVRIHNHRLRRPIRIDKVGPGNRPPSGLPANLRLQLNSYSRFRASASAFRRY